MQTIMLELLVYFSVFLLLIYWFLQPKRDRVPCPKGWPLIGNAAQLDMTQPHLKFESWAAEFGGLYKINLAGNIIYIVNGYDEFHEVLVTKGKDFAGRPKTFRSVFTDQHKNFLSTDLTPKMNSLKKAFFNHVKLYGDARQKNEQMLYNIANNMVNQFKEKDGKPFNVREIIQETVTDTLSVMVLGRESNPNDQQAIATWIDVMARAFTVGGSEVLLDVFPWLRFFGNKTWKLLLEYRRLQSVQYALWKKEAEENLKTNQEQTSFLAILLMKMTGSNPFEYDDENIIHSLYNMFGGGIATTTSSFTSLINVLVHNDDIQQRLHEESMQVLGDRQVKLADKHDMPYHMAAVYEILRIAVPAPLSLPHLTLCDTSIGGHSIPKGRVVWTNIWALHHDPKFWNDPYTFNPENFLNSSGGLVAADHPARKHMLAFGAGPRVCPGEVFALSRLFLLVASMVQNFILKPATTIEQQPSADCRKYKLGLLLFPEDFEVRFIPREVKLEQ